MRTAQWAGMAALCLGVLGWLAAPAWGQGGVEWRSQSTYQPGGQPLRDLTIEQQRQIGLSDEQIKKIAEKRRDLERERQKIEAELPKAQEAARAANAELGRLQMELRDLDAARLDELFKSIMTPEQVKAWQQRRNIEQAKQWLAGYRQWLKLTDQQVDDIALLLVPVYEKFDRADAERTAARERLAELRRADPIDVAAIEQAEKKHAELTAPNVYAARQNDLMKALRAGLLPDQIEKLDQRMPQR